MKLKNRTDIFEAVKKVNEQIKPNFFIVELSYNRKLVLPHDAGIALINALKDAEVMNDDYGKDPFIGPLEKDSIRVSSLAHAHYEDIKVARLLNISLQELHDSRMPQNTKELGFV
jgi:hypothetical protein